MAKVLLPVMVRVPAPPWFRVIPEQEMPPPAKVLADALVRLIVPVPVTVRSKDEIPTVKAEPARDVVHVPEPNAIVRTDKLAALMPPFIVTLYPFALKVPYSK